MKSLREISEQLNSAEDEPNSTAFLKDIAIQLAKTDIAKIATKTMGDDLLAISLIKKKKDKNSEESELSEQETPVLFFLTTNIEITDSYIKNIFDSPSYFDSKCPESCLITSYLGEEYRLLAKKEITDKDYRTLFSDIIDVLNRQDLTDTVRLFFTNSIIGFGRNEDAFVVAKQNEIREKQASVDTRQLYTEAKQLFLHAVINQRMAKINSILSELIGKYSGEIQAIEILEKTIVHIDEFRAMIFRKGNADFVEEIAEYRLFDKGLIVRLLGAAQHLKMVQSKFTNYIAGYAICGSWVTRGYDARRDSDLDIFLLIDDLDVVQITRDELNNKVSAVIQSQAIEASTSVGLPSNALHPTTFLLSDSYRKYYEGNAILFSMIDRAFIIQDPKGILRSWQLLLNDGSIGIGPSERYTETLLDASRRDIFYPYNRIRTIFVEDLYPGLLAGAQSLLIRLGEVILPPSTVVEKLNKYINKSDIPGPREGISHLAETLTSLSKIYRGYKQKPNMHISAEQLGQMMNASEKAFAYIEQVTESIKLKRNENNG